MHKIQNIILRSASGLIHGIIIDLEIRSRYDPLLVGIAKDLINPLRRFYQHGNDPVREYPAGSSAHKSDSRI